MDGLLSTMTPDQFDEWAAYDQVEPLYHTERMLGLITSMLSHYFKCHSGDSEIEQVATPWVEEVQATASEISASYKGRNNA